MTGAKQWDEVSGKKIVLRQRGEDVILCDGRHCDAELDVLAPLRLRGRPGRAELRGVV